MLQLSHKNLQTIKIAFNVVFIGIIAFNFLQRAFVLLPNDWLFFLTSDAVENFVCALMAYVFYYYVIKLNGIWRKIGFITLFVSILISLASFKNYRIAQQNLKTEVVLNENEIGLDLDIFNEYNKLKHAIDQKRKGKSSNKIFDYFTSFLGQALLFYAFIYAVNRIEFLNRYRALENELHQTKAQLLRNQLHPHFLFNTFNSLYSLSLKNHPETSEYILKLSRMMRYLTDDSVNKKVKLLYELQFIEEYIAIEKIRFGEQANIHLQIDGNPEGNTIEPLVLIPLVENAFKHGFYTNDANAFVTINVTIKEESLLFKVENSIQDQQHFSKENREGKGLDNLKKRLQLSYANKHILLFQNKNNVYLSQLEIKLDQ